MVVVIEAGVGEPARLIRREHAERHAGLHAKRADALDHGDDHVHVAVFGAAPGRAHAVACCPALLPFAGLGKHSLDFHEFGRLETGGIMRRLAAIAAIFRTSPRLDRQKPAHLYGVWVELRPVDGVRPKQQIIERQIIDWFGL